MAVCSVYNVPVINREFRRVKTWISERSAAEDVKQFNQRGESITRV